LRSLFSQADEILHAVNSTTAPPIHEIIAFGYFVTAFATASTGVPTKECRFCDININARQMKESKDFTFNAPVKPVKYMVEVARSIEQDATEEVASRRRWIF